MVGFDNVWQRVVQNPSVNSSVRRGSCDFCGCKSTLISWRCWLLNAFDEYVNLNHGLIFFIFLCLFSFLFFFCVPFLTIFVFPRQFCLPFSRHAFPALLSNILFFRPVSETSRKNIEHPNLASPLEKEEWTGNYFSSLGRPFEFAQTLGLKRGGPMCVARKCKRSAESKLGNGSKASSLWNNNCLLNLEVPNRVHLWITLQ